MAKKYVATIMNRLYLGDFNFIYYPSHTAVGTFDEKSKIFEDRNGREYVSITNPRILQSEVTSGFANLTEMSEIKELLGNQSVQDAIGDFDYLYSKIIYYVSSTSDNEIFYIPINYEDMRYRADSALKGTQTETTKTPNTFEPEEDIKKYVRHKTANEEEKSYEVLSGDVRSDIAAFFMDLMDGVYSIDDLRVIRENVLAQRDDIDALIDSIDIQIEASENGESSIKLREEGHQLKRNVQPVPKNEPIKPLIKVPHYLDIEDLFKKITKTLIAQDEPTRRVLVEIARKEQSEQNNDRGILITGQTGCGKTKMMELIAKYLDRPFLKVDSTQLTMPGYVGKDIEEVLWELYIKCGKDVKKAERAIIFFDEIDKKGSSKKEDVSGKGVLNVLLPFFDGSTYNACENVKTSRETVKINTKNMLVILGGAFEDVYKDFRTKGQIGFAPSRSDNKNEVKPEDFVEKAQMPSEFMGRVAVVKLNDLDLESIKRILLESDESALRIQERLFRELGVKLTPSEEYINAIAKQAEERKTGARGLNTVVDETTWEAYGDAYTHLGKYSEIVLNADTVNDPKQYTKIKRGS